MERNPNSANSYGARAQLARELTEAWHSRFGSRWAVVAGTTEIGEPMTFYSTDHPAPFTPGEVWSSGLTSFEEAKRLGFIGICDTTDGRLPTCEKWMKENAPDAEQVVMTTQRFFGGIQAHRSRGRFISSAGEVGSSLRAKRSVQIITAEPV